MSLKLLQSFINNLRQQLPKYPKSGFQFRNIVAVNMATTETPDNEIVSNKSCTRYKRRFVKRQWEDSKRDEGETNEKKLCEKGERIKRKKVAILLGYSGVDYYGMQRNPGVRTIEEDLLKALLDAKYITEDDFQNQQNAHFQRSSRTDKGVSAARQVVSMKLPLEVNIEEINKRLPECIKVFGVKRVTNKFNSKAKCNARSYSYTLPTYAFEPSLVTEEERKRYRITADKMEQINNILGFYKGTKSYHNFTERKHYQDPSALRYMMGFSVEKTFVESDMEFAVLVVKGQSFMLHQIRKMVGLMIGVVRGYTDASIMEKALGKEKVMIPTAPGLGLVLDKVHYDRYDNKFKDTHECLKWDEEEETVQKFKQEYIFPNIVKGELEGNSMGQWLEKLSSHSYEPSDDTSGDRNVENECGGDDDGDDEDAGKCQENDDEKKGVLEGKISGNPDDVTCDGGKVKMSPEESDNICGASNLVNKAADNKNNVILDNEQKVAPSNAIQEVEALKTVMKVMEDIKVVVNAAEKVVNLTKEVKRGIKELEDVDEEITIAVEEATIASKKVRKADKKCIRALKVIRHLLK